MSDQPLHDRQEQGVDKRGPAWTVAVNKRGVVVCRPRYWAMRDRSDPAWAEREMAIDEQKFLVAQGEAWDAPAGTPYLPLFVERVREVAPWQYEGFYIKDCPQIAAGLWILRGFDGGLHRPALIMGQYDARMGVLWVQRELRPLLANGQPIDFQAHEFVALARYMCGQVTVEGLMREEKENRWSTAAALAWIDQEKHRPFYGWEMPWIPYGTEGVKFADVMQKHELGQQNQLAPSKNLNSLWKVYKQQGLRLRMSTEGWEHRELTLGFLMREGPIPGQPRLLIDSSCKTLIRGMAGGLAAGKPGGRKPYMEDRWLEDAFDAFCNMMCLAFPLQHADRLAKLEAMQEQQRLLAMRQELGGVPRGTRPPSAPWGSLHGSYT